jgi:hypothetical protein
MAIWHTGYRVDIRLARRLRIGGHALPESGRLVEPQAFDRGRRHLSATTRARGARARW